MAKTKRKPTVEAEKPTVESTLPAPETVAESALSQAESPVEIIPVPVAPPPPVHLTLPGGSFSPEIASHRVSMALSDVGRMKVTGPESLRISGSASKGGVVWNGTAYRAAVNDREKAAIALAKAATSFAKAIREYGRECGRE